MSAFVRRVRTGVARSAGLRAAGVLSCVVALCATAAPGVHDAGATEVVPGSADVRATAPAALPANPAVSVRSLVEPTENPPVAGLWRNLTPNCDTVGSSGSRVQVVYAREAGKSDRFAAVEDAIREEISRVDSAVDVSARKTGDGRRVRWAGSDCVPSITRVTVPAGTFTANSSVDSTEKALASSGLKAKGRKYLVFADAARLCGVSTIYKDSSPTNNANDGRNPQYARIDTGCWNSPDWSVAAHELVHMMGGVQPTAPNALGRYHCEDANDLMCYRETKATKLRVECGPSHAGLLDCNGDDYFNTRPRKGTYLADNWNVADSSFLESTDVLSKAVGPSVSVIGSTGPNSVVQLSVPAVKGATQYSWSGPGVSAANRAATTASLPASGKATYRVSVNLPDGVVQTSSLTIDVD